jgi:cation/acetate symporter
MLMAILNTTRHHRRRTGTYLAIFASAYTTLFLGVLLSEQMGASPNTINVVLFVVPLLLFVGIGLGAGADDSREFFAAGRAVPSYYAGLGLALTAIGGTGVVCITGALFKIGMDALVLVIGWVTGLVLAGVLLFPFLRKCGAYSVPSYLGLRLDSRIVRILAALALLVPSVLILAAEVRVGAYVAVLMTGAPEALCAAVVVAAAAVALTLGGLRALTWASVTQSIAVLAAMALPATIVSLLISNLPIPQMMHGNLLQGFRRIEESQPFPVLESSATLFRMPSTGLDAFTNAYLQPFAHVGRLSMPLAILVIAGGIAALPALLNRAGTTTTVYESRKSMGWAVLTAAFMLLTLASIAGFMRGYVTEQIVGAAGDRLPLWFQSLQQLGFASVAKTTATVTLDGVKMQRDVAFMALPMAAGLPAAVIALVAAGALAAAVAGVAAHINAIAGMIAEDLLLGGRREAPEDGVRVLTARAATVGAAAMGLAGGMMTSDPLAVVLVALAISAATAFPVLVMSILWRKVSRTAAIAGMATGFGVTLTLMFGSFTGMIGLPPVLAAAVGGPASFLVIVVISEYAPLGSRRAMEVVRDLRQPGGEATYDREMRTQRRKRTTTAL